MIQSVGTDRRRWSLWERMSGQYWRIARRRRLLCFLLGIFRDDLTIYPLQYEEAVTHLSALRRAVEAAYTFYRTLEPESVRRIQPWGVITKLADFDGHVTELLLYVVAMQEASAQEQIFARIQLHLTIRHLFPALLVSFDDLCSQLKALPGKVEDQ